MNKDRKRAATTVAIVALCWLIMFAGDWAMRFVRYEWHRRFFVLPPAPSMVTSELSQAATNEIAARAGGDLSNLLGIQELAEKYAVPRRATVDYTDEYGFRNKPPTADRFYPVVVVGDSYMNSGVDVSDTFSSQLEGISGPPTYNHALAGQGPILAIDQFFEAERFLHRPPKVLVWGLSEREIHTHVIAGSMVFDLWIKEHPKDKSTVSIGGKKGGMEFKWTALKPASLHNALPNTSIMAQAGSLFWNKARYLLFGQATPDVIPARGDVLGTPMLFYRLSIEAMQWGDEFRNIPQVVWGIKYLSDFCERRGITLVVVLIPDKAQVYREYLPDYLNEPAIPPSCLWAVEEGLRVEGVPVVNMLGPFREKAKEGVLAYWPDDTHWNEEGIRMAAEAVAEEIGRLTTDDGRRRTEDGGRRTDDGGRTTDQGLQTTDYGPRTEDRGRRTEDGRRKTEDRRRRTDDKPAANNQ